MPDRAPIPPAAAREGAMIRRRPWAARFYRVIEQTPFNNKNRAERDAIGERLIWADKAEELLRDIVALAETPRGPSIKESQAQEERARVLLDRLANVAPPPRAVGEE